MNHQLQSLSFACHRASLTVLARARAAIVLAECEKRARVEPADPHRASAQTLG